MALTTRLGKFPSREGRLTDNRRVRMVVVMPVLRGRIPVGRVESDNALRKSLSLFGGDLRGTSPGDTNILRVSVVSEAELRP
jgi:hypothetical protein